MYSGALSDIPPVLDPSAHSPPTMSYDSSWYLYVFTCKFHSISLILTHHSVSCGAFLLTTCLLKSLLMGIVHF